MSNRYEVRWATTTGHCLPATSAGRVLSKVLP